MSRDKTPFSRLADMGLFIGLKAIFLLVPIVAGLLIVGGWMFDQLRRWLRPSRLS